MRASSLPRSKSAIVSTKPGRFRRSHRPPPRTSSIPSTSPQRGSSTRFVSLPRDCHPERSRRDCHPERSRRECHPERSRRKCHPERSRRTSMNTAFYDLAKATVRTMARVLWRARVFGAENVPAEGPLIVACNHLSYLDPPLMGCLCPRRISYMAKKELFEVLVLGAIIRGLGAYA